MRKSLLTALGAIILGSSMTGAETITLNDKDYEITTLIDRDLGPGVHYKRLRLPSYPLNVNLLIMDVSNPYNRIETTQASDQLYKTESLVTAAKRQTYTGHKALAGANANFWCVATQEPWSDLLIGATYNGNLRNGKIITETNMHSDQWNGGTGHTGIVGVSTDRTAYSGHFTWRGYISNDKIGETEIYQVNKVVRDEEIDIYNAFYGTSKNFMCVNQYYKETDGKNHFELQTGVATEVYLQLNDDSQWSAGNPVVFTVKDVKQDAGDGTLGSYDLAIVGRGSKREILNQLSPGDQLTLKYNWISPEGTPVVMDNLVGGNAQVMIDGELTKYNTSEGYNSQVYSRTGYGTSADGKKLYIIVIDKATDPVYGTSAGCSTTVMCGIAKHFGCVNMTNFDAGGSAEMLVGDKIINKTTESSPRAVANGMIMYSIAPEDNVITRLEFDDYELQAPIYSSYRPRIIGYNQYGDLIDDDVQGFTLSCPEEAGSCEGEMFTAGPDPCTSTLTANLGEVSVTKEISVMQADIAIRIKPILIDNAREYPMEVNASVGENTYSYDPATIEWIVDDPEIASIDSNGILRGLKEGTTGITGKIGDHVDRTSVTVEIAPDSRLDMNTWSEWTAKGASGMNNASISEDGIISYTYASPRDAYVQISNDDDFYSLPDRLWISFNSSLPVEKINLDLRSPVITRSYICSITPESGESWAAGEDHVVEVPVSLYGDPSDLINYPLRYNYIRFQIVKNTANKGVQTITMKDVSAEYDNFESGVESISGSSQLSGISVFPNPVTDGLFTVSSMSDISSVEIFGTTGSKIKEIEASGENSILVCAPEAPGLYIVRISTSTGIHISKIIIR